MGRRLNQQRVSVGVRLDHRLRANLPTGAGTVLEDHRLMPFLGHRFADDAAGNIGA